MKLNFDYKGRKITYDLTYKRTRVISITVSNNGKVNVIAPIGTSVYAVMDKIKGNAEWIIGEIDGKKVQPKEVELPSQYMYLGKNYKLEIVLNSEVEQIKVKMIRGRLVVETPEHSSIEIRNAIVEWYKQKVAIKIKERLKLFKEEYSCISKQIEVIDDEQTLCSISKDTMIVNARIGIAPADVIDYIILTGLNGLNKLDAKESSDKFDRLITEVTKSQKWLEDNKKNLML